MRRMPSPVATATTPHGTGSGSGSGPALGLADPALLLDLVELVEQVGDPDLAGSTDLDGGLDRGADLVGVDVAVVDAVAADDDDRVADAGPHLAERRHGLVGRLEQVHHLVAQLGHVLAGLRR